MASVSRKLIFLFIVLNVFIFYYFCMTFISPIQMEIKAPDPPLDPPLDSLERKMFPDFRNCPTYGQVPSYRQTGDYWILENYIPAAMAFKCDKAVTYATHGEYGYLDNLETVATRWQGPVSIALYATGADFERALNRIIYLRNCCDKSIKKYVTFHLIYHTNHVPPKIPFTDQLIHRKTDCAIAPPKWTDVSTYRNRNELIYPINVMRNVARQAASTYFVLSSDVELYPSTNFIPDFLNMLKKPDVSNTTLPKVFVFSVFEVKASISPPETKPELMALLRTGDAIHFHSHICNKCHAIPHSQEWMSMPISPGLSVIHVGKRTGAFKIWEPFYVGTKREPIYDEKISWEGKRDKMVQMYAMCVLDYEFLILDNAFLVHRSGIKKFGVQHMETMKPRNLKNIREIKKKQNTLIKKHIVPEYKILFGNKYECVV